MYIAPDKQNWNGRVDSIHDERSFRIHQMIQLKNMKELSESVNAYNIVGFESDEGVRRNKGRQGAAKGPNAIKKMLAKLPYHMDSANIVDVGNVRCEGRELEKAQKELGNTVTHLLKRAGVPIILGGGHETLYGHYLGVREFLGSDVSLGVINIDAHFDMRNEDIPSSGTMFKQILDKDNKAGYLCLGIQELGNTKSLFKTADAYDCTYVYEDSIADNHFQTTFQTIDDFAEAYDYVMLTLCTDAITSSDAPGVSAPSPFGMEPKTVRTLIRYISSKDNITSFDISEVNPTVDENEKTVRLAALLVADVMKHFNGDRIKARMIDS